MAINQRFLIVKEKNSKEIKYFDYDKLDGYNLRAKENVHFEDAIDVSRMIIINPTFIEKIATKKLNTKFDKLINMMSFVCEMDEEDESGEGYRIALDEANKLKMELINKYKKYLDEQKLELMLKKIEILEDELKLRLEVLMKSYQEVNEKTQGRGR